MMVSIGRNKILAGNMTKKAERGFTLIELLIAMAITGVVSAAIFTAFQSQQKSYIMQEDVAAMQQNLRAGMDLMVREIRMAGYDPTGNAGAKIEKAEPDLIYLTMDVTGGETDNIDNDGDGTTDEQDEEKYSDGDCSDLSEHIAFDLYNSNGIDTLGRTTSKNAIAINENPAGHFESNNPFPGPYHQPLAENIEALGFAYAYDADSDGNLDTSPNGNIIWAVDSDGDNDLDINLDKDDDGDIDAADGPGAGNNGIVGGTAIADVAVNDIRAVRIWMLARADRRDNKYLNTRTYVVGHKVITPNTDADPNNDNLRMRLLTTTVKCRNMGL